MASQRRQCMSCTLREYLHYHERWFLHCLGEASPSSFLFSLLPKSQTLDTYLIKNASTPCKFGGWYNTIANLTDLFGCLKTSNSSLKNWTYSFHQQMWSFSSIFNCSEWFHYPLVVLSGNLTGIFVCMSLILNPKFKIYNNLIILAYKYLLNLFTSLHLHCHSITKPSLPSQFYYSYLDVQVHALSGSSYSPA